MQERISLALSAVGVGWIAMPRGFLMPKNFSLIAMFILASTFASSVILARDGQYDRNFGVGGVVPISTMASNPRVIVASAAMDTQGRIVVAGRFDGIPDGGFALRLLRNGTLDTNFASNGVFILTAPAFLGLGASGRTYFSSVKLAPQGIYLGGYIASSNNPKTCGLVVALNDSGQLRSDFGMNGSGVQCGPTGLPTGANNNFNTRARTGLVVTDDQVIASIVRIQPLFAERRWIYALDHQGNVDLQFGVNGLLTLPNDETVETLSLDVQQRLIINGQKTFGFMFQRRILPSAAFDSSFGVGGISRIAFPLFGYYPEMSDAWAMGDGRLSVGVRAFGGISEAWAWNYGFLRVLPWGGVDPSVAPIPTFTSTGYVMHETLVRESVGRVHDNPSTPDGFGRTLSAGPELVRMLQDGSLDENFGSQGYLDLPQASIPLSGFVTQALAVDPAGNIFVITSEWSNSGQVGLRVVKVVGDTLLDGGFE